MLVLNLRLCTRDFESCPCRIIDLDKGEIYCNFIPTFGSLLIKEKKRKIDQLLNKICPEKKNNILYHENIVSINQERARKFLEQVNIGDVVFCTAEIHDVVFLEKPNYKYGDCKYQNIDGKIKSAPQFCFSVISKSNNYAVYEIKDKSKADYYRHIARRSGFRVETVKNENSYLLKINGDTQDEVNDFVNLVLKNDYYLE